MSNLLELTLLGLGVGAIYAVLAQGAVLIYRGSGVLNFAHGTFAMLGAYLFNEMVKGSETSFLPGLPTLSTAPAFAVAVAVTAALGVVVDRLVMARLRQSSGLTKMIATLAVLIVLQAVATLRYGGGLVPLAASVLPRDRMEILGTSTGTDRVWLLAIAVVITLALAALFRWTRVGLATAALSEGETSVAALGWSPANLSSLNWAAGCGLAGAAGIFIAPISGLDVNRLTLVVIAALAAALVGRFSSFPLTLAGGLILGVSEQVVRDHTEITGADTAVPLLVIIAVLTLRGSALPLRGTILDRLPAVGTGRVRPLVAGAGAILGIALLSGGLPVEWTIAITISLAAATVMLSVVVVTGYAGQLSLAQMAFAGIAALVAGRLVDTWDWPLALAAPAAIAVTVPIGVLLGLPALRTRGVSLGVITLGLGLAVQNVVFNNGDLTTTGGLAVGGHQRLFGLDVQASRHPERYAQLALLVFVALAIAVANLRRGRTGRQMIAVRGSERGSAALGINVVVAKLNAFGLGAGIAAAGGIVLAFRNDTIQVGNGFSPFDSVVTVANATIGGIGYVAGPLLGAAFAGGGVGTIFESAIESIDTYLPLIGGIVLLLTLVAHPDGTAATLERLVQRLGKGADRGRPHDLVVAAPVRVAPMTLEVRDLTVRLGATLALADVALELAPGEVLGVIGPNGAGKTTLLDAISGFVAPATGSVHLDGAPIDGRPPHARARLGLNRSFQGLELFDELTVFENLQVATDPSLGWGPVTDLVHPTARPLPAAAVAAVHEFGLVDVLDRRPGELPYGQRRLVAIARAIASEPSVLLLDEPAAGLDAYETAELATIVRRLAVDWGIGVLVVEHDMDFVFAACDRVLVLEFGLVIASGLPEEIRADARVRAAYLGEPEVDPDAGAERLDLAEVDR